MEGRGVRDKANIHSVCQLCGALENLMICGGCRATWYCSKEHQKYDWKYHKKNCKAIKQKGGMIKNDLDSRAQSEQCSGLHGGRGVRDKNSVHDTQKEDSVVENETRDSDLFGTQHDEVVEPSRINGNAKATDDCFRSLSIASADSMVPYSDSLVEQSELGSSESYILESNEAKLEAPNYSAVDSEDGNDEESPSAIDMGPLSTQDTRQTYFSVIKARNEVLGEYVVKCLNQYGICVVDNFLGEGKGSAILDEVKFLHSQDLFTEGQLVNKKSGSSPGNIRGDMITWVDGNDENSKEIQFLISSMDAVILQTAGKLVGCSINGRTKVKLYRTSLLHIMQMIYV